VAQKVAIAGGREKSPLLAAFGALLAADTLYVPSVPLE
jgi:hypothetical protein